VVEEDNHFNSDLYWYLRANGNDALEFINILRKKYNPKKIVCCEPISFGMSLLNPKHYEIRNFNLTNKDLPNGNKHFINGRQILIL